MKPTKLAFEPELPMHEAATIHVYGSAGSKKPHELFGEIVWDTKGRRYRFRPGLIPLDTDTLDRIAAMMKQLIAERRKLHRPRKSKLAAVADFGPGQS